MSAFQNCQSILFFFVVISYCPVQNAPKFPKFFDFFVLVVILQFYHIMSLNECNVCFSSTYMWCFQHNFNGFYGFAILIGFKIESDFELARFVFLFDDLLPSLIKKMLQRLIHLRFTGFLPSQFRLTNIF